MTLDPLTYPTGATYVPQLLRERFPDNFRRRNSRTFSTIITADTDIGDWDSPGTIANHIDLYLVDCTAGDVVMTLPKANRNSGRVIEIVRIDASANDVIVRIGGVTFTMSAQFETSLCLGTETNWLVRVETFPGGDLVASVGYGEIYVANNSGGTAQSIGTSFVKLTQFDTEGLSLNFTSSHSSDILTPASDGTVEVSFTGSISGTASRTITLAVFNNGVEQTNMRCAVTLDASGNPAAFALSGLVSVTAAQDLDLRAVCSAASTNVLIEEGNLRARVVA